MLSSLNDRLSEASADAEDDGYKIGTVVVNEDPMGLGRIKVRVPNLFDPAQGDVPWVGPHKKSPFGIGVGYGVYGSPALGSQVRIKLQDGDPHYALFEADEYPKAAANPKFKSPKTWGFKDPKGNELFVNMETDDWQFTTHSGVSIKYDAQGNAVIHIPKDETTTIGGDGHTTVTGRITLNVGGDAAITVAGATTLQAASVAVTASGTVNISGSDINLN